jgi:hypothetical protein
MMARCEAVTIRSGGRVRCRREAVELTGACEYPDHQRQVAAARRPTVSQETPAPIGAGVSPQFQEAESPTWDALPAAGELDLVSEIAGAISGGAAAAVPVDRFERAAAAELGVRVNGADDPFVVDRDQRAAREEIRTAITDQVTPLAARFSAARCEAWIRILVAPKLVRDGKDQLTADEITEGAQLASEWLQWVLGEWAVHSLAGRTVVWASLVYGARYLEELLGVAAKLGQFVRRRVKGLAAAAEPAAAAPAGPRIEVVRDVADPWAQYRNPAFTPAPQTDRPAA